MTRLQHLLQLHEAAPTDTFLLFALAKEHEKTEDDANALAFYLLLRRTDPRYVGLYYHLGKLYERMQRIGEAVEAYRAGIEVSKQVGDRHAQSELSGALLEWEDL